MSILYAGFVVELISMTIKPKTQKLLEEFVKRVEYTTSPSYLDGKDKIVGGEAKKIGDKWEVNFFQPSDEKRDALLFNNIHSNLSCLTGTFAA